MSKKFSFIYPITVGQADTHRREGLTYDHVGDWRVNGVVSKISDSEDPNEEFKFEIEEILYDGTDLNPVLETAEMVANVKAACLNHIQNLFDDEPDYEIPSQHKIGGLSAKIICLPLLRKVR